MTPLQLKKWRESQRTERTMTIEEAADMHGYTSRQWWNFEQGRAPIPKAVEVAIREAK